MKFGLHSALRACSVTRAEVSWQTVRQVCIVGLSKRQPLLIISSFGSQCQRKFSPSVIPAKNHINCPRFSGHHQHCSATFPISTTSASLRLEHFRLGPLGIAKGRVYSPLFSRRLQIGSLNLTSTMSGKSWFSLSNWIGSGSQEEGASAGAKEEEEKKKEGRNGEAGPSSGGAAAKEHKRHDRHDRHGDHHHGHRKKHKSGNQDDDGEIKYPAVDTYGPITIKGSDLIPGKRMKWCTCGLSLKAPWCDGRHKKTGFKSLKWEVPEEPQSVYQFCNCQYTKTPPFCDGTHTNLPEVVEARQRSCPNRDKHEECQKLCTGCGFKVDF